MRKKTYQRILDSGRYLKRSQEGISSHKKESEVRARDLNSRTDNILKRQGKKGAVTGKVENHGRYWLMIFFESKLQLKGRDEP